MCNVSNCIYSSQLLPSRYKCFLVGCVNLAIKRLGTTLKPLLEKASLLALDQLSPLCPLPAGEASQGGAARGVRHLHGGRVDGAEGAAHVQGAGAHQGRGRRPQEAEDVAGEALRGQPGAGRPRHRCQVSL